MNPIQLCGFCQSRLKTITSNTTATEYTLCENWFPCAFFTKTSLLEDYCTVLLYRVKQIYKDLPPYCEHNQTATLYLSRTETNFNRPFFACANNKNDSCAYFQWADQDPTMKTLALNHNRPLPVAPPEPSKKPTKKSRKQEKETTPIKVLTLPVKRIRQFQKVPKAPKIKKENPPETTTTILQEGHEKPKRTKAPKIKKETILQEGNIHDPGTLCTPEELQSIEQLLETTFHSTV